MGSRRTDPGVWATSVNVWTVSPKAAASSTRSPERAMPSVTLMDRRSARRRSWPEITRYKPWHRLDWLKMVSPGENARVFAEAVRTLLVPGGQASNSASGCVETASIRFDLASDCIVLSPLHGRQAIGPAAAQIREHLPADPLTNSTYLTALEARALPLAVSAVATGFSGAWGSLASFLILSIHGDGNPFSATVACEHCV